MSFKKKIKYHKSKHIYRHCLIEYNSKIGTNSKSIIVCNSMCMGIQVDGVY